MAMMNLAMIVGLAFVVLAWGGVQGSAEAEGPVVLLDCAEGEARKRVGQSQGEVSWGEDYLSYRLPAGKAGRLTITPVQGKWDLSGYNRIALDMGAGAGPEMQLKVVARNPGANDWSKSAVSVMYLGSGEREVKAVYLMQDRKELDAYAPMKAFDGMTGLPGGFFTHWNNISPANVIDLSISVTAKDQPQELRIYGIKASHPIVAAEVRAMGERFFPFIDGYGQYIHGDWPGKVKSVEELRRSFAAESKALAEQGGLADRSRWGGWKEGPKREATGYFRTEKIEGKWWLIDPEGYLFWSHGVTGVGVHGASTRIKGRERYFTMPAAGSELAQFASEKEYDFLAANLYRALGRDWREKYLELSHQRLSSWGLNTLGNWSQAEAMRLRRTPYTVAIHYWSPQIGEKLPDPFAPEFAVAVRKALQSQAWTAGDPWCMGYFVDNELHWGQPMGVVGAVMRGPATMSAKVRFVQQLRASESKIEVLNAKLGSKFADWEAVLKNVEPVKLDGIKAECEKFYRELCEAYFETCAREVRRFAPHQLYLGCRFNNHNAIVMEVAGRTCDVISYNLYDWDIRGKSWAGVDKPFISSEFHFGAQDRGMWGLGLRWASSQADRARLYRDYVNGALANPMCVGTHWFQYNSQAFTGRGDGENYQVGMTDIAGKPWPELREAILEVGRGMYRKRHGG